MTQGKRVELSAAQRTEVWCRWKAGQSLHTIGRACKATSRGNNIKYLQGSFFDSLSKL
jgi:hypothetical protein